MFEHTSFCFLASGVIPLWIKVLYTAFVLILVPVYWRSYGPTNFLYFCDVALLMALPGIWLENSLLVSAPMVGIAIPQAVWIVDFLAEAFGYTLTGMTAYMFDSRWTLFTRALSFFHFWLPFFLLYAISRLGYDRHALLLWTVLSIVLLCVCYFLIPGPPAPEGSTRPVNINYVHGLSDKRPQQWVSGGAWLLMLLVGLPLLLFLPTHLLLAWLFPSPHGS